MSNRYRYGDTSPAELPRATGWPVQVDDLCYWNSAIVSDINARNPAGALGIVAGAASYPWAGTLAATQAGFAALFIGVSAQRWPLANVPPIFGGQDGLLRVNINGVYDFACAPGSSFSAFQYVGPDYLGTALLPQQVIAVTTKANAIGKVETSVTNTSIVRVRIFTAEFDPLINL